MNALQNIFLKSSRTNGLLICFWKQYPIFKRNVNLTGLRQLKQMENSIPLLNENGKPLSIAERIKMAQERPFKIVQEILSGCQTTLTKEDWLAVKTKAFESNSKLNETSFNAIVLRVLFEVKDIELSKSFLNYMEENKENDTVLTLSYKMAILRYSIDENKDKNILHFYDMIKSKDTVYDAITLENIICGLSSTTSWKEALKLADNAIATPTPQTYIYLAEATFKNEHFDSGFNFMEDLVRKHHPIEDELHLEFFRAVKNIQNDKESKMRILKQYFEVLRKNIIIPSKKVALEFRELIHSLEPSKWQSSHAKIGHNSRCPHCDQTLPPAELTAQQFERLRDAVLHFLVKDKNIFYNTTPKEFERFATFMEATKPYDIVLDGLNLLYAQKKKGNTSQRLLSFAEHFANDLKMKVLVLGRYHLKKHNPATVAKIQKVAGVYLFQDVSQDDPMIIYATMLSGSHTFVATRDMLRNHHAKLPDPELQQSFSLWQSTRQILPEYLASYTKLPPNHRITAQGSFDTGLHFPYGEPVDCYDFVKSWICFKRK